MVQAARITSDCRATSRPGGETLYSLEAGSEFRLLREDDREYYKIACAGRPVYVLRSAAILVDRAGEELDVYATPMASHPRAAIPTRPVVAGLRIAAGAIGILTLVLAGFAGSLETDPPGYEVIGVIIVLVIGGFLSLLALAISFVRRSG